MRLMPGVSFAARYVIQGRVRDSRLYREVPAIDALADEPVMLWLVRQRLLPSAHAQARFLAEAGRLHRLKLDGTVPVSDAGVDGENVYVAVPDLRRRSPTAPQLEHGRGIAAALAMASQIAPVLDRAHAENVVHGYLCLRDLVFLRDRVLLTGVGLWRMLERVPLCESLADEPSLSPEARAAGTVTARSDVYGFAALCARFVLGVGAIEGGLLAELELRLPRLAVALAPALADNPAERPSTCKDVLEALENAFLPVRARGTLPPASPRPVVIGTMGGAFRPTAPAPVAPPPVFPRAPSSPPVPVALAMRTPGFAQQVTPLSRQTVQLPPPPPRRLPSIAPLPPVAPAEADTAPGLVIGTSPDELDAALAALEATVDVPFEDFLGIDGGRERGLPDTLREKIKLGPPHAPAPPPRRQS
jgi:hypothetical protein